MISLVTIINLDKVLLEHFYSLLFLLVGIAFLEHLRKLIIFTFFPHIILSQILPLHVCSGTLLQCFLGTILHFSFGISVLI